VQDLDPDVQRAVNRIQSAEQTLAIIAASRAKGLAVNVDLIYGLPKQTLPGFASTLDTILAARPDRLAVYGYAHLPNLFKAQRQIDAADLPGSEAKLALLQLAIAKLTAAGYLYVGMDHFALPEDELACAQANGTLHRNFMGYTTHAESDLIGFGVSAISHIGSTFSQNPRDLTAWENALDQRRIPVWRGMRMDEDDELRGEVIQSLMCHGVIDLREIESRFDIDFTDYFAGELQRLEALQADGLVTLDAGHIRATPRGRMLVRVIAACFDRYLKSDAAPERAPTYSRVV
jgi:oxygen-independent coproporphyrinogen-3 oxidase